MIAALSDILQFDWIFQVQKRIIQEQCVNRAVSIWNNLGAIDWLKLVILGVKREVSCAHLVLTTIYRCRTTKYGLTSCFLISLFFVCRK